MTVAVVGGTGALGGRIVAALRDRDIATRVLSRHSPEYSVDLRSGAGLAGALNGCDTVIDASNGSSSTLVEGARRLLLAEHEAGVGHHVVISIVGCDETPMSYYTLKYRQEQIVEAGDVPWSIVRATQFHTLFATMFRAAARVGILPIVRAQVQPVDVGEVATFAATVAVGGPQRARAQIVGPDVVDARELAAIWRRVRRSRAIPTPIHVPGRIGRALRAGTLTTANPDARGGIRFAEWLAARDENSDR